MVDQSSPALPNPISMIARGPRGDKGVFPHPDWDIGNVPYAKDSLLAHGNSIWIAKRTNSVEPSAAVPDDWGLWVDGTSLADDRAAVAADKGIVAADRALALAYKNDAAASAIAAGTAAATALLDGQLSILLPAAANGRDIVFLIQDNVNQRTAAYVTDDGAVFLHGELSAPALKIAGAPLDLTYVPMPAPMVSVNGIMASEISLDPVSGVIVSVRDFNTGRLHEWVDGSLRAIAAEPPPPLITRLNDAVYDRTLAATLSPVWGAAVRNDSASIDVYCRIGQSWDQANNAAAGGSAEANTFTPTALNSGVAFMLGGAGGINPRGTFTATLVDLQEGTNAANSQETGFARFANAMVSNVTAVLGSARKIACTASAEGGQPVESYLPGGKIYQRLLDQVSAIHAAGLAQYSARAIVRAVFTRSPQENAFTTPREDLARKYSALLLNFAEDVKRITGQVEAVRGFISQISSFSSTAGEQDASLFALDLHRRGTGWTCCGPMYWAQADGAGAAGTGGHLSTFGYACVAMQEKDAAWQQLHRNGFTPVMLLPAKTRWISTGASPVFEVAFSRAIVEDTSGAWVATGGLANKGIDVIDDVGAQTISAVSVLASTGTASIAGNNITLSDGAGAGSTDNLGSKIGNGPWALWCTVAGVTYGVEASNADVTFGAVAAALAAAIPGATVAGNVVTCPSAPSAAAFATNKLRITLAAKPGAGRWRVLVAGKWQGTGAAVGSITGARSLFRNAVPYDAITDPSAVVRQLFHWACHDSADIPRY